ncbi:tRNA lysidine(34) synthetase TilS [Ramlibacter sp. AW1]|uniref:tRNA(Ile)-lysidine synthase n=1 Tax=Ramlibacter aurantiacus TaxID=2801330 RepID=A0A937D4N5_9BURK|nr:tRNA lysidine(34) synthetase TilS [Ramlibacter aurantiacus]MBL0420502.1 tRNA lysidine(34) synthetase TilS [Ramlibacter aurantiacus]
MAASPTPRPTPAEAGAAEVIDRALQAFHPELPLGLAFSGGADSTALLVALARRWPGQLRAIHVHHGLQAAAAGFERHCIEACAASSVPLHVQRVDARHALGESPEDAARIARYCALAQSARALGLRSVALAHHADDQVETLLLALSRGAGLPGLAAMPARFRKHGITFERPLLAVPGATLRGYLRGQGLSWVEDPSNADTGFTRNRIRQQLLPALQSCFPGFRQTFARSARHLAQAQELLESLAEQDLATWGGEPSIPGLRQLPRARQANALRHWLRGSHGVAASTAQLDELLDQIADCRTRGHRIRIKVARGFVERTGERLGYTPAI